jgi:hypothetical protein
MTRAGILGASIALVLVWPPAAARAHEGAIEKAMELAERAKKDRAAAAKLAEVRKKKADDYAAQHRTTVEKKAAREQACAAGANAPKCQEATKAWTAEAQKSWAIHSEILALDGRLLERHDLVTRAQEAIERLTPRCTSDETIISGQICFDGNRWRPAQNIDRVLDYREQVRSLKVDANTSPDADRHYPRPPAGSGGGGDGGDPCGAGGTFQGYTDDGRPICGHPADPL